MIMGFKSASLGCLLTARSLLLQVHKSYKKDQQKMYLYATMTP